MLKGEKMVLKIYISQSRNLLRCSSDQEEVCCNQRKSAKQIWDSKSHSSLKDINCCVSVYVHPSAVPLKVGRGCWMPWSWWWRRLWAVWPRCLDLKACPLCKSSKQPQPLSHLCSPTKSHQKPVFTFRTYRVFKNGTKTNTERLKQ